MPGPPPPPPAAPPPMCPPPPPAFTPSPSKSSSGDNRGALLQSIRQGAKLKKAVTNDRSAPVLANKTSTSNNNSNMTVGGGLSNTNSSSIPNGIGPLGGLFAGGMPKLRPTLSGKQLGVTKTSDNSTTNTNFNSSNTSNSRPPGSSQKTFSNIQSDVQSALKKQMASDSNKSRGPPPPAPVRNISSIENLQNTDKQSYHSRNGSSNGLHVNTSALHKLHISPQTPTSPQPSLSTLQANHSTLHRKANSSANLTVFESSEITPSNNSLPSRPSSSRKPHLAPKPPVLNGKPAAPPKKLLINGRPSGISRAQSMRSPRSPSPQSPDDANNYHAKFGTVRNISSVLDKSLGQNLGPRTRPALNGRPTAPPPSIPPQQMPPPPPSKMIVKPPNHAPPPPPNVIPQPPNHAPPPPPHRTNLQQPQVPTRAPPAVPVTSNAPPPPPRHSSMRDVAGRRTSSLDLEIRFKNEFHSINEFPTPGPYRGLPKFYSGKTVANKQQAPLPPNHVQLNNNRLWDSSTC